MTTLTMKTLVKNFFLFAYADIFNKRQYDMLGTGVGKNDLQCYSYNPETGMYEEKFKIDFEYQIYSILAGDFEGNGNTSIVVTCRDENIFLNYLVRLQDVDGKFTHTVLKITDTRSAPFIILNSKNTRTSLFVDTEEGTELASFVDGKWEFLENYNVLGEDERIDPEHTSTMVDVTGNLKSDLCVFVRKNNNKKCLKVYNIGPGIFNLIFEYEFPTEVVGPVLFGDFTQSGLNSMVYIEKDLNESYNLCLLINNGKREIPAFYKSLKASIDATRESDIIFNREEGQYIKVSLNELCQGAVPMFSMDFLSEEDENMHRRAPAGLFATDIDLDGCLELFITLKDTEKRYRILPLKYDANFNTYKIISEMEDYMHIDNLYSFSTVDYNNRGKEDIIINRRMDGSHVVECYTNDLNKMNMKLSLTTSTYKKGNNKFGMPIPGTSYMLVFNDGNNIAISTNYASGSFLQLTSQTTNIGLGDSTFMIDYLHIGLPENRKYKNLYHVSESIIQNFDLIVYVDEKDKYKIVAFFNTSEYTNKIILVLASVITANFVSLLFLYWRNKRKLKIERANDCTHSLFRSL